MYWLSWKIFGPFQRSVWFPGSAKENFSQALLPIRSQRFTLGEFVFGGDLFGKKNGIIDVLGLML